ncbi:MAG: dTDP-4-dehydrorhamnose 3,5-epimerase [Thaumarchaeota archaeon]|nr:MAG: dTDP-4-dehydrorhamnose 3,5-epimerase [Nitrososphaerota archaeon]
MKFFETNLKGSYIIELEKLEDERGFFTRIWDEEIFQNKELNSKLVQISFSFNKKKGTLRGMHFQEKPFEETKIVRCVKGKIFDVIIDLRSNSKTYKKWISIELNSNDLKMIYIPEGFAHGFQTLEDNTEVMYQMSNWFSPEHAKGIRWNDQEFDIKWPINEPIISKKDQLHELQNTRRE